MSFTGKINRFYRSYIQKHMIVILSWTISFVLGLVLSILLFFPEPERWQNVITLLAVLTSLLIGGVPEFRRWNDRPSIEFDYDKTLDNCTDDCLNLHLKIINNGKTTARNVNVRVVDHIKAIGLDTNPHYLLHDVDLQNQYSRTVCIFRVYPNQEPSLFGLNWIGDRWHDYYYSIEKDERIFDVIVTGDNFPARTFHIFLNKKEDWKESDFDIAWSF